MSAGRTALHPMRDVVIASWEVAPHLKRSTWRCELECGHVQWAAGKQQSKNRGGRRPPTRVHCRECRPRLEAER